MEKRERLATTWNFAKEEPRLASLWKEERTYERQKELSSGGKPFYFLDGPPYTTGEVHIGTAWNKSLKDFAIRYYRMNGFHVLSRPGFVGHIITSTAKLYIGYARPSDREGSRKRIVYLRKGKCHQPNWNSKFHGSLQEIMRFENGENDQGLSGSRNMDGLG